MIALPFLDANTPSERFPPLHEALDEPNGLLAAGGCLSSERLINAYRHGVFPWFSEGEPILWWSPDPRLVLFPHQLHISKRLAKTLRQAKFEVTTNRAFARVIEQCAAQRCHAEGTWISEDIKKAYIALHQQGIAHSFEAWREGELVGGLYGIKLGRLFFGESMFHTQSDASKVAFVHGVNQLASQGVALIDCQVYSEHLASLGAEEMSRAEFSTLLTIYCA